MNSVLRKIEAAPIDGTPVKRMFWSIISDYDIKTGLFELVDNSLDLWRSSKKKKALSIDIQLDVSRQMIEITDNAGGVQASELNLLITPGGSRNNPEAEVIGIFGVGSKRAGIALGEHVEIRTRHKREASYQIDITKDWLTTDTWELPTYRIPDISVSTTKITISQLRRSFTEADVHDIRTCLGETYSWFIEQGCKVALNGTAVSGRKFDQWAYPPDHPPVSAQLTLDVSSGKKIEALIEGGLIRDRLPESDNYGVYIYCNRRLVAKDWKTREVGYFVSSEAGVPHPDASLCRVIVHLNGGAQLMPWNSSKSGINSDHPAFQALRPTLIQMVSHFSSLSRRLKDDWEGKVFQYSRGAMSPPRAIDTTAGIRLVLPELPKVRKLQAEHLKAINKSIIKDQPWTLGLIEAMAAVSIVTRQRLETKNRIALILLDSNFEISLKEFVVHRTDLFPPSQFGDAAIQKMFEKRHNVIREVAAKVNIPDSLLKKAQHYYLLRNKLIHERATVGIVDSDVETYRDTIQKILRTLFGIRLT